MKSWEFTGNLVRECFCIWIFGFRENIRVILYVLFYFSLRILFSLIIYYCCVQKLEVDYGHSLQMIKKKNIYIYNTDLCQSEQARNRSYFIQTCIRLAHTRHLQMFPSSKIISGPWLLSFTHTRPTNGVLRIRNVFLCI